MAIKNVTLSLNGTTYTIPFDSASGKYKKQITAPAKSSYSQQNHKYAMVLKVTDEAGNVTTVDSSHATYGSSMLLRVKETVAPTITVSSPGADAYLTNGILSISIDITDNDAGVNGDSIVVKLDDSAIDVTKTAITNGYRCTYSGSVADGVHTITVNASDNDGNNAKTKSVSFTIDTVPPTLNISSPAESLITNKQSCSIEGVTNDATSGIARVVIKLNGVEQGTVSVASDGSFTKTLSLKKGTNTIDITATDKAGKTSSATRSVVYDPDAPVIVSIAVAPNPVVAAGEFTVTVEATD